MPTTFLGPVSGFEYDFLQSKLGGTRGNWVFSFFEIEAPQHSAEAQIANQKATATAVGVGGATAAFEKKKRKRRGPGPSRAKHSKLLEFLTLSPLRSAGESEDDGGKGSPVAAASPPIAARPITVAASSL